MFGTALRCLLRKPGCPRAFCCLLYWMPEQGSYGSDQRQHKPVAFESLLSGLVASSRRSPEFSGREIETLPSCQPTDPLRVIRFAGVVGSRKAAACQPLVNGSRTYLAARSHLTYAAGFLDGLLEFAHAASGQYEH